MGALSPLLNSVELSKYYLNNINNNSINNHSLISQNEHSFFNNSLMKMTPNYKSSKSQQIREEMIIRNSDSGKSKLFFILAN